MKAVAVLVARIFATSVANGLVFISTCGQPGVDVVFVGMDQRALGDAGFDDGLDRGLANIGQHLQDNLAAALDHAENGRLFLFERSAPSRALQSVASALAAFFSTAAGL